MTVFIHRYKHSHDQARRQLFKAHKKGKAILLEERHDGWLFKIPDDFPYVGTNKK